MNQNNPLGVITIIQSLQSQRKKSFPRSIFLCNIITLFFKKNTYKFSGYAHVLSVECVSTWWKIVF